MLSRPASRRLAPLNRRRPDPGAASTVRAGPFHLPHAQSLPLLADPACHHAPVILSPRRRSRGAQHPDAAAAGRAAPLGSGSGRPAAPLLGSPPRLPPCFLAAPLGCVVQRLAAAQQHEEFEYHSHTIYVSIILLPDSLLGQPSVKIIKNRRMRDESMKLSLLLECGNVSEY
ncbi:hypothetical protein EJB05_43245 [Eragrostis curvula]|uniref:Uncharacterized protein n=1 Tax=Eragrostis curvula TaxID=38414 RepID=A0A5J9TEC0_9POAL|nr:hypothetical protein EJB05_43245 [Eragrostis curvula]